MYVLNHVVRVACALRYMYVLKIILPPIDVRDVVEHLIR